MLIIGEDPSLLLRNLLLLLKTLLLRRILLSLPKRLRKMTRLSQVESLVHPRTRGKRNLLGASQPSLIQRKRSPIPLSSWRVTEEMAHPRGLSKNQWRKVNYKVRRHLFLLMSSLKLEPMRARRLESPTIRGRDHSLRSKRRMTRRVLSKSNLVRGSSVLERRTLRRTSKCLELLLRQIPRVREVRKVSSTGISLKEMVTMTSSIDNLLTTEVQTSTKGDSTSNKDPMGNSLTTKVIKAIHEDLSRCTTVLDQMDLTTSNSVLSTPEIVQVSSQVMESSSRLRDNLTVSTKEKLVTTSTTASTLLLGTSRTDVLDPDHKPMLKLPLTLSLSTRPTPRTNQGETQEFRSNWESDEEEESFFFLFD